MTPCEAEKGRGKCSCDRCPVCRYAAHSEACERSPLHRITVPVAHKNPRAV